MVEAPETIWPERLTLRDSKVYADEGQRIFTTATGHGYEKQEYVRSDIAERQIAELRAKLKVLRAELGWQNAEAVVADWRALKERAEALATENARLKALPLKDEVERAFDNLLAAYAACNGEDHPAYVATRSLLSRLRAGEQRRPTHRHKKRGSEYVPLGYGKMQANEWYDRLNIASAVHGDAPLDSVDMCEVAIYRGVHDGPLWARPREEFEDGRFEVLPAAPSEQGGDRG